MDYLCWALFFFEDLDENDENDEKREKDEKDNDDNGSRWITFARLNPPFCGTLTGPNVASNSLDQHEEKITSLDTFSAVKHGKTLLIKIYRLLVVMCPMSKSHLEWSKKLKLIATKREIQISTKSAILELPLLP